MRGLRRRAQRHDGTVTEVPGRLTAPGSCLAAAADLWSSVVGLLTNVLSRVRMNVLKCGAGSIARSAVWMRLLTGGWKPTLMIEAMTGDRVSWPYWTSKMG